MACALVQNLDDPDAALAMLDPYFERVTSSTFIRHLEADPDLDLDPIRGHARFQEMLSATKKRLASPVNPK